MALTRIKDMSHQWFNACLSQLSCCDLCGANLGKIALANQVFKQSLVCQHCIDDLPLFDQKIIQGDLLSWPAINRELPNIHFDHLFSLMPYISPVDFWLKQFKYQGRFELASLFSTLLANQLIEYCPTLTNRLDVVLSVPLHISKWQARGYNQAHLIAIKLAKIVELPYLPSVLIRSNKNSSQVGQTGKQRRKNLTDAFALTAALPHDCRHVLLVDDVVTTGSTVSEISKLLKSVGINKVTIMTICLSLPTST